MAAVSEGSLFVFMSITYIIYIQSKIAYYNDVPDDVGFCYPMFHWHVCLGINAAYTYPFLSPPRPEFT